MVRLIKRCVRFLPILVALTLFPAAASAEEARDSGFWLEYERSGSRSFAKVAVAIGHDNTAKVIVVKETGHPPIEYIAMLSSAEAAWFQLVLRSTNFENPDRFEGTPGESHYGITSVRTRVDGRNMQAKFGIDSFFDDLSHNVFRLVRQAELMKRLQSDHHAYEVLTGIRDKQVLQPEAFVEPLVTYINQENNQLDSALIALALITTPEKWGGVLAHALEQATDTPLREGSPFSRRRLLLNVITGHPFYVDLPVSHNDALIRIYRMQSAIESSKVGDSAARYVRHFKEIEDRLKAPN